MATAKDPSEEIETAIRTRLIYDRETGILYRRCEGRKKVVGSKHPLGYLRVVITSDGVVYRTLVHRLAWWMVHGEWVPELDHINGDKRDNRISNLRPCTRSQNKANSPKMNKDTASAYKGLTYYSANKTKPWMAQIGKDSVHYYLGYFSTEDEAAAAYNAKALELYGEFANLNVIRGETP